MVSRVVRGIAVVLLLAGTGPLTTVQAQATAAAGGAAPLHWTTCPPIPGLPDQQCATLRVPLDYGRQHGRQIDLGVSRLATSVPSLRRGVLLLNPGGPGGSGIDLPRILSLLLPQSVLDRYDLVGFDPRFVNTSTPITCGLTPQDLSSLPPWPLPGGVQENAVLARDMADRCASSAGDLLPFATTANTARDMDEIRKALGEQAISYLGYSYGTYLGAVYATLFPDRTDRVVLDSSVDPAWVWRDQFRAWGFANEIRFPDFTSFAAAQDATYGLGSTPAQVRRLYFELADRLDEAPLDLGGGLILTGNLFREATRGALYSDSSFPFLAALWQAVDQLTGGAALQPLLQLAAIGAVTLAPAPDNPAALLLGILCDEAAWPRSVETYERDVARDSRLYPVAGAMAANIWPCAFWHLAPTPQVPITGRGPTNILMVQNLRDPATPFVGALGMRAALAGRARMVTVDQGGHGVYLLTPNTCANDATTGFLVSGTLTDLFCGPSPREAAASAGALTSGQRAVDELMRRMRAAA